MKAAVLLRVAGKSILRNKLRSLLTMLGIIIGVAAVLVMTAIGRGAQRQIQERVDSLGTNMIVVTPGSAVQSGVSQGSGSFNRLTTDDVEKVSREGLTLAAVTPVIMTRTQAVGGQGNWRTHIYGVNADYPVIRDWTVTAGTFFSITDQRSMRKVAVLGATVADNLFPGEDPVGRQIRLRNVPFEIIGVLASKGLTPDGFDQDDVVVAPYTTVQNRLSGRQFIGQILASAFSPNDVAAAQEEIALILREAHDLAEWEADDFTVRNQADLTEAAQGTTEVMTTLLLAIASVSLLVGGIGIMNIMLVSVTERTREIGIRMAIGARGSDVLVQFLVEAVVMSIVGGALGVALGYGAAAVVSRATGWSTDIAPETVFLGLGFSAAVGIFFGFWPARKASRLDPIDALRYE